MTATKTPTPSAFEQLEALVADEHRLRARAESLTAEIAVIGRRPIADPSGRTPPSRALGAIADALAELAAVQGKAAREGVEADVSAQQAKIAGLEARAVAAADERSAIADELKKVEVERLELLRSRQPEFVARAIDITEQGNLLEKLVASANDALEHRARHVSAAVQVALAGSEDPDRRMAIARTFRPWVQAARGDDEIVRLWEAVQTVASFRLDDYDDEKEA